MTSREVSKIADFQVQKKDGHLEPFNRNKVIGGVVHAGASPQEAEGVATQIEAWAETMAEGGVLTSNAIREKVLALLEAVNTEAAARFSQYRKPEAGNSASDSEKSSG